MPSELVNERISTFLGLNNMLNPASAEYREGMAYKSDAMRIDEEGLWTTECSLMGIAGNISLGASPHGSGSHFKFLVVDDVAKIISMSVGISCDVGPNKKLYSTDGDSYIKNENGNVTTLSPPTLSSVSAADGTGRLEKGTYFYMVTQYDPTYKRESLPSIVKAVDHEIDQDSYDYATLSATGAGSGNKYRWYRTKRTYATEEIYNPTNRFYYLGETDSDSFTDRFADAELEDYEYEGRGSPPPQDIDYLVSFHNRMLFFKGNVLYWSSAGKPEEVALEYTLTYDSGIYGSSVTQDILPKLAVGVYGEAYTEIAELAGETVLAALPYRGKLYVWTGSSLGYIEATNRLEGYKFHLIRRGIGSTSDKVIAVSPYGIFGGDRKGIWLLIGQDRIIRLSEGRVDLHDSSKSTYLSNTDFSNAFGCWVPALNEYWFGKAGRIIAYQADRDIFAGPYNYSVSGGVAFANDNAFQNYLTGGNTPNPLGKTGTGELQFWLGQSRPTDIKQSVTVECCFESISSSAATLVQNDTPSASNPSGTGSKSMSSTTERISGNGTGRLFRLTLPMSSLNKLATINYKYTAIPWTQEAGR